MRRTIQRNAGLSLVELLIAITIGLLIVSVASSVFKNTVNNSMKVKDVAMLQETTFFVSHLLEQHLRQAGFKGIQTSLISGRRIPISSNADAFPAVENQWLAGQFLKTAANTVSFRFNGSSDSTGAADGSIIDCHGNSVAAGTLQDITLTLTNRQLICSSGGVQSVLVGSSSTVDVESFLIALGVDDGGNTSIDSYKDSTTASNDDILATREVVIRLLLASNQPLDASSRTYTFNNSEVNYPDDRYRREVVVRAVLRNVMDY